MLMLFFAWLSWWYTTGWLECMKRVEGAISGVLKSFSVTTLLRTLFAPWKQIVAMKDPNENIQMKIRGFFDTLVSRFVGFFIRTFTLLTAVLLTLFLMISGGALLLMWPLLPVAVPVLITKGIGIW